MVPDAQERNGTQPYLGMVLQFYHLLKGGFNS